MEEKEKKSIVSVELEPISDEVINETESLLSKDEQRDEDGMRTKKDSKKEGLFFLIFLNSFFSHQSFIIIKID